MDATRVLYLEYVSYWNIRKLDRHHPRIFFLFSDTGGGHRSAAQAIIGALEHGYPNQVSCEMVDIFRDFAPALLDRIPDIFPPLARNPKLLGQIFYLSDDPRRIRRILKIIWPYIRSSLNRLISERQADLFISVHPLINFPLGTALVKAGSDIPWITVVTDLVTAHTTWFCPQANLIIVPTENAHQIGLKCGVSPDRMKIVGLPVAEEFSRRDSNPREIRARLGWPLDEPVVLLMGGGEGMGQLEDIARAVDDAGLPVVLVIVAGRNIALQQRLEGRSWKIPVRVYGFVKAMPDFMQAATILLTKAGPSTISEAVNSGLPVILYGMLNGSEDGNVSYIVDNGAGRWAPQPDQVVTNLIHWLENPEELSQVASACQALARPLAAREIAALIMAQIQDNV
jgi:1,2-diacylglycerol 3-beta-galactosyltransferase